MGQMTADQYLDQIQNQLMKTLTEKKDAMPPGFNQQRFALNCITVIRDMMKDYKKREQLQTVDINSIVLCMIKGAYLGLDFLNGECYAIPYKGEMTFQTDYKGEIKVCKRFSDDPIKDIYAKVVREGDVYDEGVEAGVQKLSFKPVPFSNKNIIGAFAVVMYADGTIKYDSMSVEEINWDVKSVRWLRFVGNIKNRIEQHSWKEATWIPSMRVLWINSKKNMQSCSDRTEN